MEEVAKYEQQTKEALIQIIVDQKKEIEVVNRRRHASGICGTFGRHVVLKTRYQIYFMEVTVHEEIRLPILVKLKQL